MKLRMLGERKDSTSPREKGKKKKSGAKQQESAGLSLLTATLADGITESNVFKLLQKTVWGLGFPCARQTRHQVRRPLLKVGLHGPQAVRRDNEEWKEEGLYPILHGTRAEGRCREVGRQPGPRQRAVLPGGTVDEEGDMGKATTAPSFHFGSLRETVLSQTTE